MNADEFNYPKYDNENNFMNDSNDNQKLKVEKRQSAME